MLTLSQQTGSQITVSFTVLGVQRPRRRCRRGSMVSGMGNQGQGDCNAVIHGLTPALLTHCATPAIQPA